MSLPQLIREIANALDVLGGDGDIWIVDDASDDNSPAVLGALAATEPRLRVLRAARRVGQSGALALGFAAAAGDAVVTLDGDLQNDPRDAPRLVAALEAADVVCGVRIGRRDSGWRRFSSRVAFAVRNAFLHDQARDTGCGLKAFRRAALARLVRFDGWHRFLPALARREGLCVVHLEVSHRPRMHGHTHYGTIRRAATGLIDLMGVFWLTRRRLPASTVAVTSCRPADRPDGSSTRP